MVHKNRSRGRKGVKVFEIARGYFSQDKTKLEESSWSTLAHLKRKPRHLTQKASQDKERPIERTFLCGALDQPWVEKNWQTGEVAASFFHAKQIVNSLLRGFGLQNLRWQRPQDPSKELPYLHPGVGCTVSVDDTVVGYLGEIHPKVSINYGLGHEDIPIIFELDLEKIFELSEAQEVLIDANIAKFPPTTRDLALAVDKSCNYEEFETVVRKFPKRKNLKKARLFDLYEGENLDKDKKSIAAKFTFQSPDKTLTDKEVEKEFVLLSQWVCKELKARQR